MSAEPSPRPWTFCPTYGEHRPNSIIVDADGGNVALVCYFANEEEENRIGNLIVNAANERDRLRDLVKRMIPFVEKCHSDALDLSKTIKGICALKGVDTSEIDRINSEHDALIAEARAAIGEGEP